ncbi:MAG: OmpH family outer membrane protein [Parachlamydia sp.]|nr:OmpH family outer membrane protein [Parachlamydia sp.]
MSQPFYSPKSILLYLAPIFLAFIGAYFLLKTSFKPLRIAYVSSETLIYNYEGTKEAKIKFDALKQTWQTNLDTLNNSFQRSLARYNNDLNRLSPASKQDWEKRLSSQRQQIEDYRNAIEERAQKEDQVMMQPILNQINSFIKEYAIRNEYDLVIGTSENGTVVYGKETLDITNILLKDINKKYKGE